MGDILLGEIGVVEGEEMKALSHLSISLVLFRGSDAKICH
jgi:hypothetical protein